MAPYAFYGCGLLNIVEFDEDSELESIGAQSFEKSCFTGLSIPPRKMLFQIVIFFD